MPPFRWDLVTCAGKVLARGGDAQLEFVGRSLDSMFDLLSGAIPDRVTRLPLSFAGFTPADAPKAREVLAEHGITPQVLARQAVTFVDVVSRGGTFEKRFSLLDNWIVDSREPWDVIRRQLRFVGVTVKGKTSPNTWRWQQHTDWTARLPARAVQNVSLPYFVWTHFDDHQTKLTRSFRPAAWYADAEGPNRGDQTRQALRETWLRTLVTGLRR